MDALLGSDPHFLLGAWIRDARNLTLADVDAAALMEFNARAQVTTWDDRLNGALNDYAAKQWAGIIKDYIAPRWNYFASKLIEDIIAKKAKNNNFSHQIPSYRLNQNQKVILT